MHPEAWSLAVDATSVYWFDEPVIYVGALMKCAKSGCNDERTVLATEQASPTSIAVDAASAYWVNEGNSPFSNVGAVMKCDVGGCAGTPLVLASGQAAPYAIALDAAFVWSNFGTESAAPTVARCGLGGCGMSPTVLAAGKPANVWGPSLAVDATSIYWMDDISLAQCPKAGCNGPLLTLNADLGGRDRCRRRSRLLDRRGVQELRLRRLQRADDTVASPSPPGIAQDGAYVYWTGIDDNVGRVMKCAVGGCGGVPTVLAAGLGNTTAIAVDQTSVYWIEYPSGIWMDRFGGGPQGRVMKLTPK